MEKRIVVMVMGVFLLTAAGTAVYADEGGYEKALNAYLKKDYQTAHDLLREYTTRRADARAYYLLGYAHYMHLKKTGSPKGRRNFWGDTETAEYFRKAFAIDPRFSPETIFRGK